jgi:argininosuccinate lyase
MLAKALRDAVRWGRVTRNATELADYLVRKGLPFRDAHDTVLHDARHGGFGAGERR